jgi:hypothetical protein
MASIKKWSTGKLGNDYPDHSNNGNPNSRGLTDENVPGIEAYIEEDDLIARLDNRPLKNLSLNDDVLEENISIVASEVDYGVLHDKGKEFDIEILPVGEHTLQDGTKNIVTVSPIRINAGQAIINGASVTIGRQKIAFFSRDDGSTLFPDYDLYSNTNIVPMDDPGYTGNYMPTYSSSVEFPANHIDYEIKIINEYAEGILPRTIIFKTYRNYEDIIPPVPESKPQSALINFGYDENFSRESEGVWLMSEFNISKWDLVQNYNVSISYFKDDITIYDSSVYIANVNPSNSFIQDEWNLIATIDGVSAYDKNIKYERNNVVNYNGDIYQANDTVLPSIGLTNIKIDNAVVKKDMEINEYLLPTNDFELNNDGDWVYNILTNKIFYSDVKFSTDVNSKFEIADLYVSDNDTSYIIYKPRITDNNTRLLDSLYIIPEGATQASNIPLRNDSDQEIKKLIIIRNKLFVLGTNGYLSYFDLSIVNNTKVELVNIDINEIIVQTFVGKDELQGMPNSETYVDMLEFSNELYILTENGFLLHEPYAGEINVDEFDIIDIKTEIENKVPNVFTKSTLLSPLFGNSYTDSSLKSIIRNYVQNPSFEKGSIGNRPPYWDGNLIISQDGSKHGACKAKLNGTGSQTFRNVFPIGSLVTLSFYCKVPSGPDVSIDFNISDGVGLSQRTVSAGATWERYVLTHTVQSSGEVVIRFLSSTDVFIDCVQLEEGEVSNRFVISYDYLMVGFQKFVNNTIDPCFALIDANNLYEVQYEPSKYGNIKTITQVIPGNHNDAIFTDGKYIYRLIMLNSVNEYDRYSITNLSTTNSEYNILGRVEKINNLCYFDDKLFIGGNILNKSIKINIDTSNDVSIDSGSQPVKFLTNYDEVVELGYGGSINNLFTVPISTVSQGICSFTDILGEYKVVNAHDGKMQSIEFVRTEDIYETLDGTDSIGHYIPNKKYFLALQVGVNRPIVFEFVMPGPNRGSISIDYLFNSIINSAYNREYNFKAVNTEVLNKNYESGSPLHLEIVKSTVQMDGLYSTGIRDISIEFRNDIRKIVLPPNNKTRNHYDKYIYILTKVDILRGQYDQNFKKTDTGDYLKRPSDINGIIEKFSDLPISPAIDTIYEIKNFGFYTWNGLEWVDSNYINKWKIKSNFKLKEVEYKYNVPFVFTVEGIGNNYLNLPVSVGYDIVPGSLRIKTNIDTEYGFSENIDYYVDYDNNKVILSTNQNLLFESDFDNIITPSSFWKKQLYLQGSEGFPEVLEFSKTADAFNTFDGESVAKDIYTQTYITSSQNNTAFIFQSYKPKSLNIGDTFTFSMKFKALTKKICAVYVIESNTELYSIEQLLSKPNTRYLFALADEDYNILALETAGLVDVAALNTWHTKSVTHAITNSTSQYVYAMFEYKSDYGSILMIKEPQLEKNQIATPYITRQITSKIDSGSSVYLDFAEIKELDGNPIHTYRDYTFDTEHNRIIYHKNIQGKELYLNYLYEREFNKYVFGTSIPKFDIITDPKDDMFIHYFSGRIWAINSMIAIISQDIDHPMTISYNYIIPRIDKIKLRNTPDFYGNYAYYVKGVYDELNPYSPYDIGVEKTVYTNAVGNAAIKDVTNNDQLYTINVVDKDFLNNDIYDRRIYMSSKSHKNFNMSLYQHTAGYFPFAKDFQSTSGINPLNTLNYSKIVEIIKNFKVKLLDEVGAWSDSYDITLRNKIEMPSTSLFTFVDTKNGDDDTLQPNEQAPLHTINEAVKRIKRDRLPAYIMIMNDDLITEDVNIDHIEKLKIIARTKTHWRGNVQNLTEVVFQGIIFEDHNFYVVNNFEFYYCTFIDCTVNNYIPVNGRFYNCIIRGCRNTFLYIRNTIIPSPFTYPYMKNVSNDDSIEHQTDPYGATSDAESIHPDAKLFLRSVSYNASGDYIFTNCLIHNNTDSIIKYEAAGEEQWVSTFTMGFCTFVKNDLIFYTNKVAQTLMIKESIISESGRYFEEKSPRLFDSVSNINLLNNYIDRDTTQSSEYFNHSTGIVYGLIGCLNGMWTEPGFINSDSNNYRLKSEAAGFLSNSICVNRAMSGGDLGCYNETRNRLDVMIPQKLKSPVAYIAESIYYPLVLNSEKITFSVEMKPLSDFNKPAILFDTRTRLDDVDYVMVCYNNNTGYDSTDFNEHPNNPDSNPRTFKIIVANGQIKYAVLSPIEITSDNTWQAWHDLSFTVNFEMVYTGKAAFDEKDRYQNIITFYHNNTIASESYLKNDMNYDNYNVLLKLRNGLENAWNYNDIDKYISIGGSFDNKFVLTGYYSELRIDNRFIDRKELENWNKKEVPFNDPIRYVNQNNFARTFDSNIIQDLWTLRTDFDVGMKGHELSRNTSKQIVYHEGEEAWALSESVENLLYNGDIAICPFVHLDTDEPLISATGKFPCEINGPIVIKTRTTKTQDPELQSNVWDRDTGAIIDVPDGGIQFDTYEEVYAFLDSQLKSSANDVSQIYVERLPNSKLRFITSDIHADVMEMFFFNRGDPKDIGFIYNSSTTYDVALEGAKLYTFTASQNAEFDLPPDINLTKTILVYINGVLQNSLYDSYTILNTCKIQFNSVPPEQFVVAIVYYDTTNNMAMEGAKLYAFTTTHNTQFNLPQNLDLERTVLVYINGVLENSLHDSYTLTSNSIVFNEIPPEEFVAVMVYYDTVTNNPLEGAELYTVIANEGDEFNLPADTNTTKTILIYINGILQNSLKNTYTITNSGKILFNSGVPPEEFVVTIVYYAIIPPESIIVDEADKERKYIYTEGINNTCTITSNEILVNSHITIAGISTNRLENHIYTSHEKVHNFNSQYTSLGFKKDVTVGNNSKVYDDIKIANSIKVYFETNTELTLSNIINGEAFYTFSMYVYNNEGFTDNQVKFIISREGEADQYVDFDYIENITGFWWKLSKTFSLPVLHQDEQSNDVILENIKVGLQIYESCNIVIDSFQLMAGVSRLPFVVNVKNDNGKIEVDNAIINKEKGIIFFRFNPLFAYAADREHVLCEILNKVQKVGDEERDESKDYDIQGNKSGSSSSGLRVYYDYNKKFEEGTIHFRLITIGDKPDIYSWDLAVLPQLWNAWHTIAISYDFYLRQYVLFFDYFKIELTAPTENLDWWTNLYIGHPAPSDVTNDPKSANILVRDLLITNYMISQIEVTNWINAYEFYRESSLSAILKSYQTDMLNAITRIEGISIDTLDIENSIEKIETKLIAFDNILNSNINLTLLKVRLDQVHNQVYQSAIGLLDRVVTLETLNTNFNLQLDQVLSVVLPNIEIYIGITNALTDEIADRIQAIDELRSDLASNELGYGATLIGINDNENQFVATTVEAALVELKNYDDSLDEEIKDLMDDKVTIREDFAFIADGNKDIWTREMAANGYNMVELKQEFDEINNQVLEISVGLTRETTNRNDEIANLDNAINSKIDALEVLLKGENWDQQTIKDNYDLIQTSISNINTIDGDISSIDLTINQMKGTDWDSTMNLAVHTTNIAELVETDNSHSETLETHTEQIENLYENLNNPLINEFNSSDYQVSRGTSGVYALIGNEILERIAGDLLIRSDLKNNDNIAVGKGADLIGITLQDTRYAGMTVQQVIDDLSDRLNHVKDLFNWKDPVETYDDLPDIDNNINDTRLVNDDGDGKSAQYSWNGTEWTKVADVDWGTADAISYSNTRSKLYSTDVQGAIDELKEVFDAFNTRTFSIARSEWKLNTGGDDSEDYTIVVHDDLGDVSIIKNEGVKNINKGMYYVDVNHSLDTINIAVRSIMTSSGMEIGVDEYERLNQNVLRIWVANPISLTATVFGAKNTYSAVVGDWILEDGKYSVVVDHYMSTRNIMTSVFDIESKKRIGVENIEFVDDNSIKIWTQDNTVILNVFLVKRTSEATTKDLNYWKPVAGMYEAKMPISTGFDAAYQFYNPSNNLNIEVDEVVLDGQLLIIRKTNADPVRVVIIK